MRPDASTWAWDVEALILVPALALSYALAIRGRPVERWRMVSFGASLALIAAVSITPLQTVALNYLLSAHLLQNVVLAEWAPALFVLGIPPFLAASIARLPLARYVMWPPAALVTWLAVYFFGTCPSPMTRRSAIRRRCSTSSTRCTSERMPPVVAGPQDEPWRLRLGRRAGYLFAAFLLASPLGLLLALIPEPLGQWVRGRARPLCLGDHRPADRGGHNGASPCRRSSPPSRTSSCAHSAVTSGARSSETLLAASRTGG